MQNRKGERESTKTREGLYKSSKEKTNGILIVGNKNLNLSLTMGIGIPMVVMVENASALI